MTEFRMLDEVEEETLLDELEPAAAELLYGYQPQSRLFFLEGPSSPVMMGMMIEESEDSFLVGIPAKLASNADGTSSTIPYLPVKYLRLQKTSVKFSTHLFGIYAVQYVDYLKTQGGKVFPQLAETIQLDDIQLTTSSKEDDQDLSDELSKLTELSPDEESRVAEALEKGGLIIPDKKVVH